MLYALFELDENDVWQCVGSTPHEELVTEFLGATDPDDYDPRRKAVSVD